MKKIIFSFDDGLLDFYDNVFPILRKYNISATLNVITGFSDKNIKTDYNCCSINQLKELLDYGIELANHSNDHVCPEPIEGYDIAQKKLNTWFPKNIIYGIATPYTQQIPEHFYEWCHNNKVKYIRLGDIGYKRLFQKKIVKKGLVSYFRIYCHNNSHYIKRKGIKIVYSIPIWADKPAEYYKNIIEVSSFNPKITFMFHSIFDSEEEFKSCPYPEGAWTISKLEDLIKWILDKGYKICRQCDTL